MICPIFVQSFTGKPRFDMMPMRQEKGNEADSSSLYSAEVTNGGDIPLLLHMSSGRSAQLMKPSATLAFILPAQLPSWEERYVDIGFL
jgi:hypothetical protein